MVARQRLTTILLPCVILAALGSRSAALTFVVDDDSDQVDSVPGDGVCATSAMTCTVRAAIMEANALAGPDAVQIPDGRFRLQIPQIMAGEDEDGALRGDLDITDDLTITGAGVDRTRLDGGHINRVVHVLAPT